VHVQYLLGLRKAARLKSGESFAGLQASTQYEFILQSRNNKAKLNFHFFHLISTLCATLTASPPFRVIIRRQSPPLPKLSQISGLQMCVQVHMSWQKNVAMSCDFVWREYIAAGTE